MTVLGRADHQKLSVNLLEPIVERRAAVQYPLVPQDVAVHVRRGMLRHVVLFTWRADVSDEQLMSLRHGLSQLPDEIPHIVNFFFGDDLGLKSRTDADWKSWQDDSSLLRPCLGDMALCH